MAQDERTQNMDAPEAVATAAREGNVDAVKAWLAAGGAPDATGFGPLGNETLLSQACMSSRPSCAAIAEILCAAGAHASGVRGGVSRSLSYAAMHGAGDTVRVLLRYGVNPSDAIPLLMAVQANDWIAYMDDWTRANAQAATSLGHQGMVRLLLKHGAAVDAKSTPKQLTPLILAAKLSGFVSLGVVRELLAGGADLNIVSTKGRNAEAHARRILSLEIYTGEGIPEHPRECRRPGAVEAFLALLAEVRAAGSWKRYVNKPRIDVVVLQRLCAAGRASPPPALARLFPTSTKSPPLPKEMVWLILKFWRTDRDP